MRTNFKTLLLTTAFAAAFNNTNGWKKDEAGALVLDGEGNPIFVNAGGQEQSVRGDTISNLNAEARRHREAKEAAEAKLAPFEGIDPVAAKKAVETVGKLDAKQLLDAGEVDRVKETIKAEFTGQLAEKDKVIAETRGELDTLRIDTVFNGSDFIRDSIAVPADMVRSTFGKNFKVEEGKIVAYGKDGNRLLSKKNQGEYADADEALQLLVDMHPQKDMILKAANPGGGSGNGGGGGARGAGKIVKRADFEALPPHQQAEMAGSMAKGEISIVD